MLMHWSSPTSSIVAESKREQSPFAPLCQYIYIYIVSLLSSISSVNEILTIWRVHSRLSPERKICLFWGLILYHLAGNFCRVLWIFLWNNKKNPIISVVPSKPLIIHGCRCVQFYYIWKIKTIYISIYIQIQATIFQAWLVEYVKFSPA